MCLRAGDVARSGARRRRRSRRTGRARWPAASGRCRSGCCCQAPAIATGIIAASDVAVASSWPRSTTSDERRDEQDPATDTEQRRQDAGKRSRGPWSRPARSTEQQDGDHGTRKALNRSTRTRDDRRCWRRTPDEHAGDGRKADLHRSCPVDLARGSRRRRPRTRPSARSRPAMSRSRASPPKPASRIRSGTTTIPPPTPKSARRSRTRARYPRAWGAGAAPRARPYSRRHRCRPPCSSRSPRSHGARRSSSTSTARSRRSCRCRSRQPCPRRRKAELTRLSGRYLLVGCLSGSPGTEAAALVGVDGVQLRRQPRPRARPAARRAHGGHSALPRRRRGSWPVEDKGLTLSFHYRTRRGRARRRGGAPARVARGPRSRSRAHAGGGRCSRSAPARPRTRESPSGRCSRRAEPPWRSTRATTRPISTPFAASPTPGSNTSFASPSPPQRSRPHSLAERRSRGRRSPGTARRCCGRL